MNITVNKANESKGESFIIEFSIILIPQYIPWKVPFIIIKCKMKQKLRNFSLSTSSSLRRFFIFFFSSFEKQTTEPCIQTGKYSAVPCN